MNARAGIDDAALAGLIAGYPLAWIIPRAAPEAASPMPLITELDEHGAPRSLLGHLPRRHPLVGHLNDDPRAVFLFQGPHGYISPESLSDKDWAPTWNFAIATIEAEVAFDETLTDTALRQLVEHMERDRRAPWQVEAMGERYATLSEKVIGFRATITASHARFKLGQDESQPVFDQLVAAQGDSELGRWMRAWR
ncbi:MAG: FMN-binding negative transcriptional regulator [Pseudomonadota bacterium]